MERVTSFNEITSDNELAQTLEDLYHTVEDIDLLIGIFAENSVTPSGSGETIRAILVDQFERLRDSDRFWYERSIEDGGFFTSEEIEEIQQTTYADIIKLNSEITNFTTNVFSTQESNPIDDGLLDLTGLSGEAQITVTREASFKNSVGFYLVADKQGTIVDSVTGETWTPDDQGYAAAAIARSIESFTVENNLSSSSFSVNLPGGSILAPYLIQNGSISDFESGETEAFFSFSAANSDKIHHILELGNGSNNTFRFAFEDMTGVGSNTSDRDFNDIIMEVSIV